MRYDIMQYNVMQYKFIIGNELSVNISYDESIDVPVGQIIFYIRKHSQKV